MKYNIAMTEQAEADLGVIYEHIAFSLLEPQYAAGQINRLESQILTLESLPEQYKSYDKEPWFSRGLRQMPVDNFLVLYLVEQETKMVTIIRIMYEGRDTDSLLWRELKR